MRSGGDDGDKNEYEQILNKIYGQFICGWWKFWNCETWTIVLEPIEGHGFWNGKKAFGELAKNTAYEGPIAVLTRATIRITKLNSFWSNVAPVAVKMNQMDGFIKSFGIGEIPWIKQATFSLWDSKKSMQNFAYKIKEHATVIQKTKKEHWYSEEMFVRFNPLVSYGSLDGMDPLERKPYIANN